MTILNCNNQINNLEYDHLLVEKKWRKVWDEEKTFAVDLDNAENPYYNLMMFPYPSAEGLHVGNFYAFTGSDINGRYNKLLGYDVFEPMGWDAFGIHSENYAKKIGSHPITETPKNVANFKRQFSELGALNDWDNEINTTSPEYYRWNQWLFLKLFEEGLAYKKMSNVNWCPECQTVISNEQVIDGKCERHGDTDVEKKEMEQWFLKITEFADDLYTSLDELDWSKRTKLTQKNWIGKKEGFNLSFQIEGTEETIDTFTTRIDTLFGVTFLAISCDNKLAEKFITEKQKEELLEMKKNKAFSRKNDKEGIKTNIKVIHPITKKLIPVYIANYIENDYGTGAIMGVPSLDKRDKEFADKLGIEQIEIYKKVGKKEVLINSLDFNGLKLKEAIEKISLYLEEKGLGKGVKEYKLRDWCISRQRYWGTPIPMVNCTNCGIVPEKPENLPIKLPEIKDYKLSNDGKSPLSLVENFVNTECPCCGGEAIRETDVMDNFFDSSWYFFRYLSANDSNQAYDLKRVEKWLPVDTYIGGNEHAVLHLMYTRFITKFLNRIGEISFDEPFKKFFAHGLIIKDGKKMSKSKGNVINPDDYIEKYGSDALRMYLMFLGPLDKGGDFTDSGIVGVRKFIGKINNFFANVNLEEDSDNITIEKKQKLNNFLLDFHNAMSNYKYNVAISKIMVYFGELQKEEKIFTQELEVLLKSLSIFLPYISEELWHTKLNKSESIHLPGGLEKFDDIEGKIELINLAVQISGKVRGILNIDSELEEEKVLEQAKLNENIAKYLDGQTIKKVIYVKGKIINIVLN